MTRFLMLASAADPFPWESGGCRLRHPRRVTLQMARHRLKSPPGRVPRTHWSPRTVFTDAMRPPRSPWRPFGRVLRPLVPATAPAVAATAVEPILWSHGQTRRTPAWSRRTPESSSMCFQRSRFEGTNNPGGDQACDARPRVRRPRHQPSGLLDLVEDHRGLAGLHARANAELGASPDTTTGAAAWHTSEARAVTSDDNTAGGTRIPPLTRNKTAGRSWRVEPHGATIDGEPNQP